MGRIINKKLKIDGMHCNSCVMLIEGDLEDLEGVTCAKVDFARQEGEVEFDEEKVEMDKIILTVQNSGYKAQLKTDER